MEPNEDSAPRPGSYRAKLLEAEENRERKKEFTRDKYNLDVVHVANKAQLKIEALRAQHEAKVTALELEHASDLQQQYQMAKQKKEEEEEIRLKLQAENNQKAQANATQANMVEPPLKYNIAPPLRSKTAYLDLESSSSVSDIGSKKSSSRRKLCALAGLFAVCAAAAIVLGLIFGAKSSSSSTINDSIIGPTSTAANALSPTVQFMVRVRGISAPSKLPEPRFQRAVAASLSQFALEPGDVIVLSITLYGAAQARKILQIQPSIAVTAKIACKSKTNAVEVRDAIPGALASELGSNLDKEGFSNIQTDLIGLITINIPAVCGDGSKNAAEGCDDGNTKNGDGCSSSCRVEKGWRCSGGDNLNPDKCVTVCGDGNRTADEECDDGNLRNNDGCDSSCKVEKGWSCSVGRQKSFYGVATSIPAASVIVGTSVCVQEVGQPTFSPAPGKFDLSKNSFLLINITSTPKTAKIWYTTDQSDPSLSGLVLTGSVQLRGGIHNIRAVAAVTVSYDQANLSVYSKDAIGVYSIAICGDGIVNNDEECDDAGQSQGCSSECTVENGWICTGGSATTADSCVLCQTQSTISCSPGRYVGGSCDTCIDCELGFRCPGGPQNKRFQCDAGSYEDETGQFECKLCPTNALSPIGSKQLQDCYCEVGFVGDPSKALACTACPLNYYKATPGLGSCMACPPRSFTYTTASSSVQDCYCERGYYASGLEKGELSCLQCLPGYFCTGGHAAMERCPTGMWSTAGNDTCQECPFGSELADVPQSGTVQDCLCARGYYSYNNDASPPCAACPTGFFKDHPASTGLSSCLSCPAGTYAQVSPAVSTDSCRVCSGSFAVSSPPGSTNESNCVRGIFLGLVQLLDSSPSDVYPWNFTGRGRFEVSAANKLMQQDVGANLMGVSYIRRNDAHFLLFWGYQFRFYRFSFPPAMQERNELSRASLELVLSWNNTGLTLAEPFYADGESYIAMATSSSSVYRLNSNEGQLVQLSGASFQVNSGTSDLHSFSYSFMGNQSVTYLAVINYLDVTQQVYRWLTYSDTKRCRFPVWLCGEFQPVTTISAVSARKVETYEFNGKGYLVLGRYEDSTTSDLPVLVYVFNQVKQTFDLVQSIEVSQVRSVKPFATQSGEVFLATAVFMAGFPLVSNVANSTIHRWNTTTSQFEFLQYVETAGGINVEYFSALGVADAASTQEIRDFILFSNHWNGTFDVTSSIYMWNPQTEKFEEFQKIPTIAAYSMKVFEIR